MKTRTTVTWDSGAGTPEGCLSEEQLDRFANGGCPPEAEKQIGDHLDTCEACARRVESLMMQNHPLARDIGWTSEASEDPVGSIQVRPRGLPEIPGCVVLRRIARGGMGVVYEADQPSMGKRIAVKVIRDDLLKTTASRKMFLREVRYTSRLDHPNIVKIHHADCDASGRPFYTMDLFQGKTLDTYVKTQRPSVRKIVRMFRDISDAVGYAYRTHSIIHRDLKPNNIFVTSQDSKPYLLDFGLSFKQLGDRSYGSYEMAHGPFGSPPWRSPEHLEPDAARITARSDVYCLGLCLFHALTGELPYPTGQGLEEAIRTQPVDFARRHCDRIDRELRYIICRCLEKSPENRFADGRELSDALSRYLHCRPLRPRPPHAVPVIYEAGKHLRRHWRLATAAAAVVLLVGGLSIFGGQSWLHSRLSTLKAQESDLQLYNERIEGILALVSGSRTEWDRAKTKLDKTARWVAGRHGDMLLPDPTDDVESELRGQLNAAIEGQNWARAADRAQAIVSVAGGRLSALGSERPTKSEYQAIGRLLREAADVYQAKPGDRRDGYVRLIAQMMTYLTKVSGSDAQRWGQRLGAKLTADMLALAEEDQKAGKWIPSKALLDPLIDWDPNACRLRESAEKGIRRDRQGREALARAKERAAGAANDPNAVRETDQLLRDNQDTDSAGDLAVQAELAIRTLFEAARHEASKGSAEAEWLFVKDACEAIKMADTQLRRNAEVTTETIEALDLQATRQLHLEAEAKQVVQAIEDALNRGESNVDLLDRAVQQAETFKDTGARDALIAARDRVYANLVKTVEDLQDRFDLDRAESTLTALSKLRPDDPVVANLGKRQKGVRQAERLADAALDRASELISDGEYARAMETIQDALRGAMSDGKRGRLGALLRLVKLLPTLAKALDDGDFKGARNALDVLMATNEVRAEKDIKDGCDRLATDILGALADAGELLGRVKLAWRDPAMSAKTLDKIERAADRLASASRAAESSPKIFDALTAQAQRMRANLAREVATFGRWAEARPELVLLEGLVKDEGNPPLIREKGQVLARKLKGSGLEKTVEELVALADRVKAGFDRLERTLRQGNYRAAEQAARECMAGVEGTWLEDKMDQLAASARNHGFKERQEFRDDDAKHQKYVYVNSIGMLFVPIPPNETPKFYMCTTETTNAWYKQFSQTNGDNHTSGMTIPVPLIGTKLDGPSQPVVRVSFQKAEAFCRWLTDRDQKECRRQGVPSPWEYRLPDCDQWEIASRAGVRFDQFFGYDRCRIVNGDLAIKLYAWYDENSGVLPTRWQSREVAQLKPNPWGLYDIYGNVWEWCTGSNHRSSTPHKFVRGGSYRSPGWLCCSSRISKIEMDELNGLSIDENEIGFRVIRVAKPETASSAPRSRQAHEHHSSSPTLAKARSGAGVKPFN